MRLVLLICFVFLISLGDLVLGQGRETKLPNLSSKDTDIQILHQLLLEEKNSRRALENDLSAMREELTAMKINHKSQNRKMQEMEATNKELKTSLDQVQALGFGSSSPSMKKDMMDEFARNASDIISKMKTLSLFVSYVESGNRKVNQTLQEVLSKLDVLARNLTSVNIVIKAYLAPMLSTTMSLNRSLAELQTKTENMVSNKNGTDGKKVGFYAYSFNSVRKWPGNDNIVFEKVVTNTGNAYNNKNGVFTTPSDGLYVFIWTMTTYEGNSFNAYLMKNGNDVKYLYVNGGVKGGYETGSTSALLELKKGDTIYIRGGTGGRLEYPNVVFTGFKL